VSPGAEKFDVVVIGDVNPDVVMHGPDVVPEFDQHEKLVPDAAVVIGGSASITASACARLGLRTRVVGALGDDVFGRFMLEQLRERQVDVELCPILPGVATGFSVILSHGSDRAIMTYAGTIDSILLSQLPIEAILAARHVHIGSYFLQPHLASQLPGFLGMLRAAGVTVSVDPNWDPSGAWDGGLQSLLGQVDLFFPNAAEARALTGLTGTAEAAERLAQRAAVVALKDGHNGGLVAAGTKLVRRSAYAVDCADTTGAGDAFNAGFLKGWLSNLPVEQCLAYACASGALTTRTIGATGSQPTYEEVLALAGQTGTARPTW
jgi:sugar/nucleoside kinase (ribokinase family)